MDDDQAMKQQWETLLAAHRALIWAYVQTLGMDCAHQISPQVRATTLQVSALSELLGLPLEEEPG